MKKLILFALCASLTLGLAACGNSGSAAPSSDGASASGASASGEAWPSGNLTLTVPWKAGGGADTAARLVAKFWEQELGTKIVIENRDGADCLVGTEYYYGLKQDCNNLIFMAQPFYANSIIASGATYTMDDISVINAIEMDPSCLAVMPDSNYKTLEDLDAAIKANPGQIKFGVNGGSPHLILANLLIEHYGWDVKLVYYGGAAESRAALLGGHVDVIATTLTGCVDEVPIVIGSYDRNPSIPDVPTFKEIVGDENAPLFATSRFLGVSTEAKEAYPERYQILVDSLQRTFESDDFQAALKDAGRDAISQWYGPEESDEMSRALFDFTETYQDILSGQ